jgi:hypothetical protein
MAGTDGTALTYARKLTFSHVTVIFGSIILASRSMLFSIHFWPITLAPKFCQVAIFGRRIFVDVCVSGIREDECRCGCRCT